MLSCIRLYCASTCPRSHANCAYLHILSEQWHYLCFEMKRWGIRIDTNTIMFATSRAYSLPKPAPHRDMTKAHDDSPFAVMNSCFGDCGSKLQVMLADMQMSLSGWTTGFHPVLRRSRDCIPDYWHEGRVCQVMNVSNLPMSSQQSPKITHK